MALMNKADGAGARVGLLDGKPTVSSMSVRAAYGRYRGSDTTFASSFPPHVADAIRAKTGKRARLGAGRLPRGDH